MRSIISLFLLAFVSTAALADGTSEDTTKINLKGMRIIIIEDDSSKTSIGIEEDEDEVEFYKGFYFGKIGLRNPQNALGLAPSQIELDYWRSYQLQFNLFEKSVPIIKEYVKVSTGLGFVFNNYAIDNDLVLTKGNNTLVETVDTTRSYRKNNLSANYITVPVMLGFSTTQHNDKGLKIAGGLEFGYRLNSNIKRKYDVGGETFKPKIKSDFFLNQFYYAAIARFSLDKITVSATYNLYPLFEKGKAREMYPFSIGIRLLQF